MSDKLCKKHMINRKYVLFCSMNPNSEFNMVIKLNLYDIQKIL